MSAVCRSLSAQDDVWESAEDGLVSLYSLKAGAEKFKTSCFREAGLILRCCGAASEKSCFIYRPSSELSAGPLKCHQRGDGREKALLIVRFV